MTDAVMNAKEKCDEASFYLGLMDKIEKERVSLTERKPEM